MAGEPGLELSFEALRRMQLQERHHSSLQSLDEDFFDNYAEYIKKLKGQLEEGFSLEDAKIFENSLSVFRDLASKRKQKILLKALRDIQSNSFSTESLTKQEKEFYDKAIQLLSEYETVLSDLTGEPGKPVVETEAAGQPTGAGEEAASAPASKEPAPDAGDSCVAILADLPEFVAGDNKTYGPFAKGQEVVLPRKIAELLCNKGAAETK